VLDLIIVATGRFTDRKGRNQWPIRTKMSN